jgi:EAL domain-containing protein (putative c-di-GMP-specific phosphodiesterase class I)
MAHALGINIIPEGVENTNQLNHLEGLDCHIMQGFLFSKPLPVTDFLKNVASQHEKRSSLANA